MPGEGVLMIWVMCLDCHLVIISQSILERKREMTKGPFECYDKGALFNVMQD